MSAVFCPSYSNEPQLLVEVPRPGSRDLDLEVPVGRHNRETVVLSSRQARRLALSLLNAADVADFGDEHDEDPDL